MISKPHQNLVNVNCVHDSYNKLHIEILEQSIPRPMWNQINVSNLFCVVRTEKN